MVVIVFRISITDVPDIVPIWAVWAQKTGNKVMSGE
jgi:hypothetical protein